MFRIIAILFLCFSAYADLGKDDSIDNDIGTFKVYLRSIKRAAIDFKQTDTEGAHARGTLLIDKPFKFRCNYAEPFPILVVGNVNYVSIYDYDMDTVGYINREDNIFNFLTMEEEDLEDRFTITSAVRDKDLLIIDMYHDKSDRTGRVTFNLSNKFIKEIKILEDGNSVTLEFDKVRNVEAFDKSLFIFKDPEIFGTPARLKDEDIEKLTTYSE
jgi:outer membrane lipoprotein-sorting protein